LKLIKGFEVDDSAPGPVEQLAINWAREKFQLTLKQVDADYETFRLNDALSKLYTYTWGDFCSWFLEMIKPGYVDGKAQPISREVRDAAVSLFSDVVNVLHPFMPFVTEEIWHQLAERDVDNCVTPLPKASAADAEQIARVEAVKDIVSRVREQRNAKQLKQREVLVLRSEKSSSDFIASEGLRRLIEHMAFVRFVGNTVDHVISQTAKAAGDSVASPMNQEDDTVTFIVGTEKFFLTLPAESVDVDAERERLTKELEHQRGFIKGIEKKLSNERFVNNAPEQVVAMERKKLADGQARVAALEESLAGLG